MIVTDFAKDESSQFAIRIVISEFTSILFVRVEFMFRVLSCGFIHILTCLHSRRFRLSKTLLSSSLPLLIHFLLAVSSISSWNFWHYFRLLCRIHSMQTIVNEIRAYRRWADVRIFIDCCTRYEFELEKRKINRNDVHASECVTPAIE